MALGNILREARLARGLSTAQVAEATHMMIQLVEEIENEDFHRVAAPIYGKGFIRLFAEHVGVPPDDLIREYLARHVGGSRQSTGALAADHNPELNPRPPAAPAEPTPGTTPPEQPSPASNPERATGSTPAPASPAETSSFSLTAEALEADEDLFARTEQGRLRDRIAGRAGGRRRDPTGGWQTAAAKASAKLAAGGRQLRKVLMTGAQQAARLLDNPRYRLTVAGLAVLLVFGLLVLGVVRLASTLRERSESDTPPTMDYARIVPPPAPYID